MTKTKLDSHGDGKSFYGKAWIVEDEEENITYLQSYDTYVAKIEGGIFKRLWDDYSATTMRHINAFLIENDMPTMNKKTWESLPVCG